MPAAKLQINFTPGGLPMWTWAEGIWHRRCFLMRGIQYQYMAPKAPGKNAWDYRWEEKAAVASGFYEWPISSGMQAKSNEPGRKKDCMISGAQALYEQVIDESRTIVIIWHQKNTPNALSHIFSRKIVYLPPSLENEDIKVIQRQLQAKDMCGEMVRLCGKSNCRSRKN